MFKAFIDESYTAGGEFVLAGHVSTAARWDKFAKEWQALLRSGGTLVDNADKYHFKMAAMATTPERMSRVPAFWYLIEDHVILSLSCRLNIAELQRARSRIFIPNISIGWGFWKNPYLAATRCLLDMFHNKRQEIQKLIPLDQPVDFIFDDQMMEKRVILEAWDRYISSRSPEIKKLYGAKPQFENDQKFLQLQAADCWAWWVRKWSEEGVLHEKLNSQDFGLWKGRKKGVFTHISFTEDQIATDLKRGTEGMLPFIPVFDAKGFC